MKTGTSLALLALLAACATTDGRRRPLDPGEGRILVYLDPLPASAEGLAIRIESIEIVAADGTAAPLDLLVSEPRPEATPRQRLLATGNLPRGSYGVLLVKVRRGTTPAEPRPAPPAQASEAVRVAASLAVSPQRAAVVTLALDPARSAEREVAFTSAVPGPAVAPLLGYCASTAWDEVVVFDKKTRRVAGAIPVGRGPQGIAFDPRLPRAYVALSGEDRIAIVDVDAGEVVGRIPLRAGDQPREVAVTPDGRLLVVVNAGSNTASFLDPSSTVELGRVDTGDEPGALLLEPGGRRAYVLNRDSGSITVLDLANRAVAATLGTDARPLRARANGAGTRLYVIHEGSAWLSVFSLPDLQLLKKVHVGLGASALAVSARGDLVYVGRRDLERLQIFDPLSFFPVSSLGLAAPASYLLVDDSQNVVFALQPERRAVEAVDLVSGRSLGSFEVGEHPYHVALASDRR